MKVGVLDKKSYGKSGIDTFIKNVNPWLLKHFKDSERVEYPEVPGFIPFGATMEKLVNKPRLESRLEGYDRVFVPSQSLFHFDPENISADVYTYVHDILPVTTCYRRYSDESIVDRLDGYLSAVMSNRYMKFLAKTDTVFTASDYTGEELKTRTAFDGRFYTVRQGVDNLPSRRLRGGERDIDILYVGSLLNRKNPGMIRETLREAERQGFKAAWVNHTGVDLPGEGFVDVSDWELADIYRRSRYYLHVSFAEGMGRGPVEAQRYGVIPLSRPIPTSEEFLGREGVSWYPVESVEDVIRALESCAESDRDTAYQNSEKYNWMDTRREIAEVLMK